MFGLFNSDDGCDGHHFDDYTATGVYKTDVEKFQESVKVQELHVSSCIHSGCKERNERWRLIGTLHMDEDGNGEYLEPYEELKQME